MSESQKILSSRRANRGQCSRRTREHVSTLLIAGLITAVTGTGTYAAEVRNGGDVSWIEIGVSGHDAAWFRQDCIGFEKRATWRDESGYEHAHSSDAKVNVQIRGLARRPCRSDAECPDPFLCTTDICVDGACFHNLVPNGTECRASAGFCDPAETCDGVSNSCPSDAREPAGVECRASAGLCDLPEVCDGASAACPVDVISIGGTVCRAAIDSCDLPEACDGISLTCPPDSLAEAGMLCRATTDLCDPEEYCDGVTAACPFDALASAGTECRASVGSCDPAEACDGVLAVCPSDLLHDDSEVCRPAVDLCDLAETCDGFSSTCPADSLAPNGSPCDDGLACVMGETCQSGVCLGGTAPDCTGIGAPCNTAMCDPLGFEGNCDTLFPLANGTVCDDGMPCTSAICTGGTCTLDASTATITVNVIVEGLSTAVVRDVAFVITACGVAADLRVVPVSFDDIGSGTSLLSDVNGAATWIAASESHTLRRLLPLSFTGCAAEVNFDGLNSLTAGDFQTGSVVQDNIVDITDFSVLASRFNSPIDPTESTGADATGDGLQESADFGAIQANFFRVGDELDACPPPSNWGAPVRVPQASVSVMTLPARDRDRVDLNGDGLVDMKDIRDFAQRHGLSLDPQMERKLRQAELLDQPGAYRR